MYQEFCEILHGHQERKQWKCRSNPWPCGALSLVAKSGGERGPGRVWLGRIKLKEAGREVRMTAK